MRILIVGGTSFVGPAIAFAALDGGHDVTVINRGQTETDLPADVTRLIGGPAGRHVGASTALLRRHGRRHAYRPIDGRSVANALGKRGGHTFRSPRSPRMKTPRCRVADRGDGCTLERTPDEPDAPLRPRPTVPCSRL